MSDAPPPPRKRWFFAVRVSLLLGVLFVVVLYAVRDRWTREARKNWDRTLDVALVLVHVEGTNRVDDASLRGLRDRTDALEQRLATELARHHGAGPKPFHFRVFGLVDAKGAPPSPSSDGAADLAKQALALAGWLRDVDPRAGVVPEHFDARIYVCVRRPDSPDRTTVEGRSEQGGRIGVVEVELDEAIADFTLFVATHELMHTLGASDKYDAQGHTRVPEGLAEPARAPLYPQRFAEVMARNRPLTASTETVPESLDELAIGELTAKEIGWVAR